MCKNVFIWQNTIEFGYKRENTQSMNFDLKLEISLNMLKKTLTK